MSCRGTFRGASDRHSRCPFCGSDDTFDCNVEPVPLVMIGQKVDLDLDLVPFRANQVVRLGRVRPAASGFTEEVFFNMVSAMGRGAR